MTALVRQEAPVHPVDRALLGACPMYLPPDHVPAYSGARSWEPVTIVTKEPCPCGSGEIVEWRASRVGDRPVYTIEPCGAERGES